MLAIGGRYDEIGEREWHLKCTIVALKWQKCGIWALVDVLVQHDIHNTMFPDPFAIFPLYTPLKARGPRFCYKEILNLLRPIQQCLAPWPHEQATWPLSRS